MRAAFVTVPLGLLLAGAGLFLYLGGKQPEALAQPDKPRHPVTVKMEGIVAAAPRKVAPKIKSASVDLEEALKSGPVFVYFIKQDCPCSVDAQPLFNHLRDAWKGKVRFIGVIDAKGKDVKAWQSDNKMTDPIVEDPKLEIIKAYKATNSTFSCLVLPDGTIDHMWPGYSRDYFLNMNERIATSLGVTAPNFDPLYAPLAKTAGCYFVPSEDPDKA